MTDNPGAAAVTTNPGGAPAGAGAAAPNAAGAGAPAGASAAAPAAGAEAKWWDALPGITPEAKEYLAGKNPKDINEYTKSNRELESKITAKGLLIPRDDAPPTEWAEFYKAQGRPETADKYEFAMPPGVEPSEVDKTLQADMRAAYLEAGLTPKQAARLNNAYNGVYGKVAAQLQDALKAEQNAGVKAIEGWEAEIRKGGGDPTKARALAQTAAQTILPKDSPLYDQVEKALATDGKPGSGSAAMVDLFHRIGMVLSEGGGVLRPGHQGGMGALTGPQAQVELDRMKADPNIGKILANHQHPNYKATREQWNKLIETIDAEEARKRAAGKA